MHVLSGVVVSVLTTGITGSPCHVPARYRNKKISYLYTKVLVMKLESVLGLIRGRSCLEQWCEITRCEPYHTCQFQCLC